MTTLFQNFETFKQLCPLSHESVMQDLVDSMQLSGDKRQEKARHNLNTIIEATFSLSNEIGFAKMTMRDLHRKTGISLGGLYNYFESKEALALMITEALHRIAFNWLPTLNTADMQASERLETLIRGHVYLSELLRPWFYFVFMESKNLPEENKKRAQKVELDFQSQLEPLLSNGSMLASHTMALMQDWHVKHWKYRTSDIDEFANSVIKLVTNR